MNTRIIGIILLFTCSNTFCQENKEWHSFIYAEAGGPGNIASINIEHCSVENNNIKIGARFGLGTSRFKDFSDNFNPDFYVPFGVFVDYSLLKKSTQRLSVTAGSGLILASVVHANDELLAERNIQFNSYFQIGTSYLLSEKILFRLSYTPILTKNLGVGHWGALSIGHTF
jgi:hypothetical protein